MRPTSIILPGGGLAIAIMIGVLYFSPDPEPPIETRAETETTATATQAPAREASEVFKHKPVQAEHQERTALVDPRIAELEAAVAKLKQALATEKRRREVAEAELLAKAAAESAKQFMTTLKITPQQLEQRFSDSSLINSETKLHEAMQKLGPLQIQDFLTEEARINKRIAEAEKKRDALPEAERIAYHKEYITPWLKGELDIFKMQLLLNGVPASLVTEAIQTLSQ